MKYIQHLNMCIKTAVMQSDSVVLFGQNISSGSCLGGLTRGLTSDAKRIVINTPNIENTQVGVGFGLMLNGVSSVFFMKQQDFLLLGIDQLVNTYNFVRLKKPRASFTIVTIVVDLGYQGIQSSLNNFGDFCSIARIPGYVITNRCDADHVIKTHFLTPGFRIIGLSQRLFNADLLECDGETVTDETGEIFRYFSGEDATIICFNFAFPQGLKLYNELRDKGLRTSLFSVNAVTPVDWSRIVNDAQQTRNVIILDDSKSANRPCYHLATAIHKECNVDRVLVFTRKYSEDWFCPNSEEFMVNVDDIMKELMPIKSKLNGKNRDETKVLRS